MAEIRKAWLMMLAICGVVLGVGCDATRRDWGTCYEHACGPGRVCNTSHQCVLIDAGADGDGLPDAPVALDGGTIVVATDTSSDDAPALAEAGGETMPSLDAGQDSPVSTGAVDAGLDAEMDVAVSVIVDVAIDTRVPDAPGTCSGDDDCADGNAPYCAQGLCVACKTSSQCQGGAPICSTEHACVSCAVLPAGCPLSAPACAADSGRCVECAADADCLSASKPICNPASNTCAACKNDSECAAKSAVPGVCMSHQDGRCATVEEAIFVGESDGGGCSDDVSEAGSPEVPFCSVPIGVGAARGQSKPLVVVRGNLDGGFTGFALTAPLLVVGKNASITPAAFSDGIGITGGELYLRDLRVAGSVTAHTGIGINAQASSGASLFLHVDGCTIAANPGGGILLGGAAFDIRNTVVAGNGPGQTASGTIWGGIRVDSLPAGVTASLDRVTIEENQGPGLSCVAGIRGQGVLATGATQPVITNSCGVASCTVASDTCGASL
jgi:hypothetical protein